MKLGAGHLPVGSILKLVQTPEILQQTLRAGIKKRVTARREYGHPDNMSSPFMQIDMKIVNACNLRCKMCAQWGENGWHIGQPTSFLRDVLPIDIYKRMVDDVAPFSPWIYIWGGEPFLYRDLMPLMRYMKEKGLIISVVTNGTLLEKHAAELVDMGQDILMLSLDGPRDTHDAIRGVPGVFEKTTAGIRALQAEKKRRKRLKPYVVVLATVSKDNAHNLDEIFEVAEGLEVDGLVAYYSWFHDERSAERHEALVQEKLGITPVSQRGWIWSYDEIPADVLVDTVKRIKSRNWKFPYLFSPELKFEDIPVYYKEHDNLFGYGHCVAPWTTIEILPNGEVSTCRDYPDYVVGNLKDEGILSIWNGERYRKFRAFLREQRHLPICYRCCQLMGW